MGKINFRCSACGGRTREDHVKLCIWDTPEEAVIIEDVPASICVDCFEQFYSQATTFKIERLRKEGFPLHMVNRTIEVKVFSLADRKLQKNAKNV